MIIELFNSLNIKPEDYFMTGSRALESETLKLSTAESDYDYVLLITSRHLVINSLNKRGIQIKPSCYNGGFKFQYENKTYNIITTIFIEFMAWREALHILKHLIKTDKKYQLALKNKLSRYCLYEQLRGFLKTMLRLGECEK